MDSTTFLPFFIGGTILFMESIVVYYISLDPLAQTVYTYLYFYVILIGLVGGFILSTQFSKNTLLDTPLLGSLLFFIVVLLLSFMFIHITYFFEIIAKSFMVYLLLFFIFVTGFTIFYNVLVSSSVSTDSSYLLQLIFYLPCLITDFIKYIGQEYNTTPNVVFVLFVFEIIFVMLYFYLPQWITYVSKINRIGVMDGSVFLDKQRILCNSESFRVNRPQSNGNVTKLFRDEDTPIINTEYSLTFWVYLSSPEKRNETEIFNYANHPRMTYLNNIDNTRLEQDKYIVYFADTVSHSFSAPQQKWNFIAINYNSNGLCDLFVNGDLEKSVDIGNHMPTYALSDTVNVGAEHGIYGSISNISYYKNPQSLSQIRTAYNLLMFKNPPVF
jgi:hypothetical protein